ncbi:GLPGLI family protein [Dysgonomonadaceae bacterium PH5-43]|nr:GLPGLI family protein [Dysgonomonadaceae bacterium PH5-43]
MRIKLLSVLLFCSILVCAQNSSKLDSNAVTFIADDNIECIYQYTSKLKLKSVSEQGDKDYEEQIYFTILQANSSVSKFWDYNYFKRDSIIYFSNNVAKDSIDNVRKQLFRIKYLFTPEIVKNYPKNKITVIDDIPPFGYVYEEDRLSLAWELKEETLEVCGYECYKANVKFGGREWTVWFTPEIAISDGPWKLAGLPGLILKAEEKENIHSFEAISIRQSSNPIYVNKDATVVKIKKDKFIKEKNAFEADPMKAMEADYVGGIGEVSVLSNPQRVLINNRPIRLNFHLTVYSPLEFY